MQTATGLLGSLDDQDCLVRILYFLSPKDYMVLALAGKRIAAFLVDDAVLRATWGRHIGAGGRFDPQFGPHQCVPDARDPRVPFAVPRAWRGAAQVLDVCAHATHVVSALYQTNTLPDDHRPEIVNPCDIHERVVDGRSCYDAVIEAIDAPARRRYVKSWVAVWEGRWRASVQARVPGALYLLAQMLDPLVRLYRLEANVVPLQSTAADIVQEMIGVGLYGRSDDPYVTYEDVPAADAPVAVKAKRSLLCWSSGTNVTSLVYKALTCLLSPEAAAHIGSLHSEIARLLVRAVDLWNYGVETPPLSKGAAKARRNMIVYNALRDRAVADAPVEAHTVVDAVMHDLVPRALRQDAMRLWIECSTVDEVLSPRSGGALLWLGDSHTPVSRTLSDRMAVSSYGDALCMLTEAVPFVDMLVSGRSVLIAPPDSMHCKQSASTLQNASTPANAMPTEGAALVASVHLWGFVMVNDISNALSNIDWIKDMRPDNLHHLYATFNATVLADMIVAWRTTDAATRQKNTYAHVIAHCARVALLSWATSGGAQRMKRLRDLIGDDNGFASLLTADVCSSLATFAVGNAIKAVKDVGPARSLVSCANVELLRCACASVPCAPIDLTSRQKTHAIDILRIAIDKMSATVDALSWCLGAKVSLDDETADRLRRLAQYVESTHVYAADVLRSALPPTDAAA